MTDAINEYINLVNECLQQCNVLLNAERSKRQSLLHNNLEEMDAMLKVQQAEIMKLNNLEQKRMEAQKQAGYGDMTAEEIIKKLENSPEELEAILPLFTQLKLVAAEIMEQNRASLKLVNGQLKIMEQIFGENIPSHKNTYDKTAQSRSEFKTDSSFTEIV